MLHHKRAVLKVWHLQYVFQNPMDHMS